MHRWRLALLKQPPFSPIPVSQTSRRREPVPMSETEDANPEIICKCFQVTEETIRNAIEAGNLSSVESVTRACEAGGGCHSCHILIQLFIDQHQESKTAASGPKGESAAGAKGKGGFLSRLFGGRRAR